MINKVWKLWGIKFYCTTKKQIAKCYGMLAAWLEMVCTMQRYTLLRGPDNN
jgi:hypothetical protein